MLEVKHYTQTADQLLAHLNTKFPDGICVSDIRDTLGRQHVDLVQEGGGVHGIALAGYTYILEKMGISFMKMAGTSAGSINTLLLNAVLTKKEAELLGEDSSKYYDSRSEKVLKYLSEKDLRDFVDGPSIWRNLILKIFTPAFKKKGVKGFYRQYRNLLLMDALCFLLIIVSGFVMVYDNMALNGAWRWVFRFSFVGLILVSAVLYLRIRFANRLYKLVERFGINPGDNFEKWIDEILMDNNIASVKGLTDKFEREKEILKPRYIPCRPTEVTDDKGLEDFKSLFEKIENPAEKIELVYGSLCDVYFIEQNDGIKRDNFWDRVIVAFERRLAADPVITKEMVIVSSDITHGLKVEFPGMHKMYWGNDTNISPSKYVRASMSVPVFFKPMEVVFDQKQESAIVGAWQQMLKVHHKLEKHALFVDGGLLSNFPINVFYSAGMPVPRKPTFGIKLEYENTIDSRTITSFMDFGGSMLNTMRYFYDRDFALKQDIYKKTVRSIDTGKVHWLNFNLSDQEKLELFFRGALAATIFLSRYKSDDNEIDALTRLGENLPLDDGSFSIYGKEPANFKIEDRLISNIHFEWQTYKKERLHDRLSKEERKGELKGGASLQNLEKK